MPLHVFDTNIWIHIGRYHPPDIFVSLWEKLDAAVTAGEIRSPDEVLHELEQGEDNLADRLTSRSGLFVPLDDDVQAAVAHVMGQCATLADLESDRNRADPFVVALGSCRSGVVVTNERTRRAGAPRMRIPDACAQLGLPHTDWFGFPRARGWRL